MKPTVNRRTVLEGFGAVGGTALAGGSILAAFASTAVAGHTTISDASTKAITTDDGKIWFVAQGGRLRYEWDGLNQEAQFGEYEVRARVHDGTTWTAWRDFGSDTGPLGDEADAGTHDGDGVFEEGEENTPNSWGGDNDSNSGTGTDGFFQFKFGALFGQKSYAIAYNDDVAADPDSYGANGLILVPYPPAFDLALFEAGADGETQEATAEFEYTCRVYDGDPNDGGVPIGVPDSARGRMPVEVTNRPAEGHTSGGLDTELGGDTS